MQVLQINQSDHWGGAGIAGYRLHQGLLNQQVQSRMLVGKVVTESPLVQPVPRHERWERHVGNILAPIGLNYIHLWTTRHIRHHEFFRSADIINFHNLHTGYFNYLSIPALTADKPAVLTLHDMWSFTGHCSYSYDCDRWSTGCGQCPYLTTYPAVDRDNTQLEWKLKQWVYSRSDLTIVAPSDWLFRQAKRSLLSQFPIHHIPNGIDTQIYQPLDAAQCRAVLGIPIARRVLLFSAESLAEPRKGGDLLQATLKNLPDSLKSELLLLTLGDGGEAIAQTLGIDCISLGYVNSDRLKAIIYSAADLFIFPTRADNLPLVLQESMACGTPMISFKVGGVPDLVRPGVTGYLAEPENTHDLGNGIVLLLEDDALRQQMGRNCRTIALSEYPLELQAKRYIDLFSTLIQSPSTRPIAPPGNGSP
jgi:glycosyltransferase involved in cell wall biosynthesis